MITQDITDPSSGKLGMSRLTGDTIAKTTGCSLLKPGLAERDAVKECALAVRYHALPACVQPCHAALATRHLAVAAMEYSKLLPVGIARVRS